MRSAFPFFFELGAICCTPGADEALTAAGVDIMDLLARHARLDPGDLPREDVAANRRAVKHGRKPLKLFRKYWGCP